MVFIRVPSNQYSTVGSVGDDRIIGRDGGPNLIDGGAGADEIDGGDQGDIIYGGSGQDLIRGLLGNDTLTGETGSDTVYGGAGADYLYDSDGGNDRLYGEAGADRIEVDRLVTMRAATVTLDGGIDGDTLQFLTDNGSTGRLFGGSGSDTITISGALGTAIVDAGAQADTVDLTLEGVNYTVTLGGGRDTLIFQADREFFSLAAPVLVTDFEAGASGDTLVMADLLAEVLDNWDGAQNPFASGHLSLTQDGGDTVLSIDLDGGANGYVEFVRFAGTSVGSFTAANFEFAPDGSATPSSVTTSGNTTFGGAGDDVISAAGGTVYGGAGDDSITLTAAGTVYGGPGDNVIEGSNTAGRDQLYGGADNDTINGNDGADYLSDVTGGADALSGGNGDDYLYLARSQADPDAASTLEGGAGNDTLLAAIYNGSDVLMTGDDGADQILVRGTGGTATVRAGVGDDTVQVQFAGISANVTLGAGRDTLSLVGALGQFSTAGNIVVTDFAFGSGGDRVTVAELLANIDSTWDGNSNPFAGGYLSLVQVGADVVLRLDADGTAGGSQFDDLVTFSDTSLGDVTAANFDFAPNGAAPAPSNIVIATGTRATGTTGADTISVGPDYSYAGFLTIEAGAGDDTVTGGQGRDNIVGGAGDDVLNGQGGNDMLDGQLGDDTLNGGDGNDMLNDTLGGSDRLYGDAGDDDLSVIRNTFAAAGDVTLDGGLGRDTILFDTQNGSTATILGGTNNDTITLRGIDGSATVLAGPGFDRVNFYTTGVEATVTLGDGSDSVWVYGSVDDLDIDNLITVTDFTVGLGGDQIVLSNFFDTVLEGWDGTGNPFLLGFARVIQSGSDALIQVDVDGGANNYQTLMTLENVNAADIGRPNLGYYSGAQTFLGSSGDDVRVGSFGQNRIETYGGDDRLLGLGEDDVLIAGAGNDQLSGGDGNDRLYGGTGNDVLRGQAGNDLLVGGAGADRFVFSTALGAGNVDTIDDFTGDDTIILNLSVFTALQSSGALNPGSFRVGTAAQDADDVIVYNQTTGELFYDADGSGSGDAVLFARVDAGTVLSADDFLVGGGSAMAPLDMGKMDVLHADSIF